MYNRLRCYGSNYFAYRCYLPQVIGSLFHVCDLASSLFLTHVPNGIMTEHTPVNRVKVRRVQRHTIFSMRRKGMSAKEVGFLLSNSANRRQEYKEESRQY